MKRIYLSLFLMLTGSIFSQSQFQQLLNHVNLLPDSLSKAAAIDSFMIVARQQGIPFIEDSTANFIFIGTPNSITVPGDFNGWDVNSYPMTNISQTNFWYVSKNFELNARLDYKFVLNGTNWILDPENPHTVTGGFGPNSELAMPDYIQPWEIVFNPNIEHGTIETTSIFSTYLNATHQLKIYLPPGYNRNLSVLYPTVYFQDGFEYIDLASAVNVIDNLIDSNKIQPVIAVFVEPNNRNNEYGGSLREEYQLFFIEELVPFIDSNYNTINDPNKRLVAGASLGGNISALISYNNPSVFANCGIHSGALWVNNNEALNLIINGPLKNIKWSSIWGSYESTIASDMRIFRDELIAKGYQIDWLELPEGHSWGLWRATIDRMLEYFYPAGANNINYEGSVIQGDFKLEQNYPNPFNPNTKINFSIPAGDYSAEKYVQLKVYDVLGNEISSLVSEEKPAGYYNVIFKANNLTSGTYFYSLKAGNMVKTKKMLLLK